MFYTPTVDRKLMELSEWEGKLLGKKGNPSDHKEFLNAFENWVASAFDWNWPESPAYEAIREQIFNLEIPLVEAIKKYRNLWDSAIYYYGEEYAALLMMTCKERVIHADADVGGAALEY